VFLKKLSFFLTREKKLIFQKKTLFFSVKERKNEIMSEISIFLQRKKPFFQREKRKFLIEFSSSSYKKTLSLNREKKS